MNINGQPLVIEAADTESASKNGCNDSGDSGDADTNRFSSKDYDDGADDDYDNPIHKNNHKKMYKNAAVKLHADDDPVMMRHCHDLIESSGVSNKQ